MIWPQCQSYLRNELPEQQFNTWIRPLVIQLGSDSVVYLLAPNRFIEDWVKNKFLGRIEELLVQLGGQNVNVEITVNRISTPESVIQRYSSEQPAQNAETGWSIAEKVNA